MNFIGTYILFVIYKITFDFIYKDSIHSIYEYIGFKYIPNEYFNASSYIVLLFYAYFYNEIRKKDNASSLIILITYLLYFFPNLSFNIYNDNIGFYIFSVIYCLLTSWFYLKLPIIEFPKVVSVKSSRIIFNILLFSVIGIMILLSIKYNGLNIKFDFEDVYEIRAKIKDTAMPSIINYLKPISSMFISVGLMYYLIKMNFLLIVIFIFSGLMLYAFGAHKTDFVLLILTIILYFFYSNKTKKYLIHSLIFFNLILIGLSNFGDLEWKILIGGLYVRTYYTPSLLSYFHYDYYTVHDLLYLKEHFLHWIDSTVSHLNNSPYIIADYYFNDPEMSSNTGLIGSDFAQFGWFSLFIFPFLRIVFFKIYDGVTMGLSSKLLIISSFSFSILFMNGAFFTALISGGFLVTCLLFYFMPKNN